MRVRVKVGNMEVASSREWSRRQACSNRICEVLNWSSTSARIRAALDCSLPANSLNAASLLRKFASARTSWARVLKRSWNRSPSSSRLISKSSKTTVRGHHLLAGRAGIEQIARYGMAGARTVEVGRDPLEAGEQILHRLPPIGQHPLHEGGAAAGGKLVVLPGFSESVLDGLLSRLLGGLPAERQQRHRNRDQKGQRPAHGGDQIQKPIDGPAIELARSRGRHGRLLIDHLVGAGEKRANGDAAAAPRSILSSRRLIGR